MTKFPVITGTDQERLHVQKWLDTLPVSYTEQAVTAFVTALHHSSYETLDEIPYSINAPEYKLLDHIGDVVHFGKQLAKDYVERFGTEIDHEVLENVLLLHDIDKPLLYTRENGQVVTTVAGKQYIHGVLGAMILRDLGYSDEVISIVSTHAAISPVHGQSTEAYLLHYADFFATDHVLMKYNKTPFYQRKG